MPIETAEMIRDGGGLLLTWSGVDRVEIAVAPTPDAATVGFREARGGRLRLDGVGRGERRYARLRSVDGDTVVAAERRLPLDGPVNFRDLGGYRTADGRRVRWGRLFRADSLESLTGADLELLRLLGVRTVCDLRRDEERVEGPSRLIGEEGIEIVPLPIGGLSAETRTIATRMVRGEVAELSAARMGEIYLEILEEYPAVWRVVVDRAAAEECLPLVVHCTAGKDRTGVASALILGVLGVEESEILDDYELSHRFHSAAVIARVKPRLESKGVEFAKVESYLAASAAVMAATLDGLRRRYGGVEAYLTERAGVAPVRLALLRERLLESPN